MFLGLQDIKVVANTRYLSTDRSPVSGKVWHMCRKSTDHNFRIIVSFSVYKRIYLERKNLRIKETLVWIIDPTFGM